METTLVVVYFGFMGMMFLLAVCDGLRRSECRIYNIAHARFERRGKEDVR